jgi:hypothetical protein
MGPVTSIAAGFAAAVGAVAALRLLRRHLRQKDRSTAETGAGAEEVRVLDFELDRSSGVYRPR